MRTVPVDKEKVTKMVTKILMDFSDSGAHPGEVVLALAEALGRIIAAVGDVSHNEVLQRELVDLAVKQMSNAILLSRGEYAAASSLVIPNTQIEH